MMVEKERWGMKMGTIWRIRVDMRSQGTTCLIGFRRPCIGVFTCLIGSSTCRIRNGKLSRTQNSLKSQFLIMISPISIHLSLSLPSPKNAKLIHSYLSLRSMIRSYHRVQHTPSTAYTEPSIYWVQHTPSTASSQDRLSPAPSQSLISRRTLLYSTLYIPTIASKPMNGISAGVAPPSQSTASGSTTSKYSSHLDRSWPTSASPNSHDYGLQVHLWVTRSRPPSASLNLLGYGLQVYLETCSITASKCISKLARSGPPSASLSYTISASKCISTLTPSRPPSASLSYSITASQCFSKPAWSRPPGASLSSTRSRPPSASLS